MNITKSAIHLFIIMLLIFSYSYSQDIKQTLIELKKQNQEIINAEKIVNDLLDNMKKNDPATLAKIMVHSEEQRVKRAAAMTNPKDAEKLIDHWSSKQKKQKERTGKSRKKA